MTKARKLQLQADKLMSLRVRARGACERCGATTKLHHHHIVEKSRSAYLRYSDENSLCLCAGCHFWWHHVGVLEAGNWFREKFGADRWDYLIKNTHNYVKTNVRYYEETIERLGKESKSTRL